MRSRLESVAGFLVAYAVAGVTLWTLFNGASVDALTYALSGPLALLLWPFVLFDPVYWLFAAIGLVVGLGVLAVLEQSRLPISSPRRLPTLRPVHTATAVGTLLVAELVARFTTAAALVVYFRVWPPRRGDPELSVAFYRDALAFMTGYLDMPVLVYVGHYFPEIGAVPSGGPNMNHVLRGIGELQFFDGIGFAIVVGYCVALIVSYVVVWGVSRLVRARFARDSHGVTADVP